MSLRKGSEVVFEETNKGILIESLSIDIVKAAENLVKEIKYQGVVNPKGGYIE